MGAVLYFPPEILRYVAHAVILEVREESHGATPLEDDTGVAVSFAKTLPSYLLLLKAMV